LTVQRALQRNGPAARDAYRPGERLWPRGTARSLELAASLDCSTVAFPAISTGAYGFPVDRAARIALRAAAETLANFGEIERVTFVLFGRDAYDAFSSALAEL
jgi:O-acetyl-ADP-ribose deacetylase